MKTKSKKLDNETIKKIKNIVNDAKDYLEDKDVENLQLSIIAEFPEITFDEEASNDNRLPH